MEFQLLEAFCANLFLRSSLIRSASLSSVSEPEDSGSPGRIWPTSDLDGKKRVNFRTMKSLEVFEGTTPRSKPMVVPVFRTVLPVLFRPPLRTPRVPLLFLPSSSTPLVVRPFKEFLVVWRLMGFFRRIAPSSSLSGSPSEPSGEAMEKPLTVVLLRSALELKLVASDRSPILSAPRLSPPRLVGLCGSSNSSFRPSDWEVWPTEALYLNGSL
mmetsp:Transcript_41949/g.85505  ORF Transcript_41949/g.85505 Transcript_41949/m.85505 type:complete len:213 (+) Transcript_41949:583-1221(+)